MKNRIGASALGVCILAASLLAFAGSASAAAKVDATLRVVGANNKILVDRSFKTGTTKVKTTSKATCLGAGSVNGSDTIQGPTALGILSQAAESVAALRPLDIASDLGFGQGLCTVGGVTPSATGYWALKVDHADSMVGGSSAVLKNGTVVLWFLYPDYNKPAPGELFLSVPANARKNQAVRAKVFSYNSTGRKTVVKGARLNGVNAPATNGNGVTTLKLKKTTSITARKSGSLVSNRVKVVVGG